MNVKMLIIALLLPFSVAAQGFAGLGTDAEGFAVPTRPAEFDFPTDHGPHPDYRIEWWYLTANLTGPEGTSFGLQWTLFRTALAPYVAQGWASPQLWMGHAAVTTPTSHHVAERLARGSVGQAGVTTTPFDAWIDDWRMHGPDFDRLSLHASGADFAYDMALIAQGPLIYHGQNGYSEKSADGQASYYYSQPFYEITGILTLPQGEIPVSGEAWLDREWSSQPLSDDQVGWDWFSLSFDEAKLMGFQLRQADGDTYTSATWINSDGTTQAFEDGALQLEPLRYAQAGDVELPVEWRVALPDKGVDVTVAALNANSWMNVLVPYWEGPVRVRGTHSGRGYLEMTGYE